MLSTIIQMVVLVLIILIVAGKSRKLGNDEGRAAMYEELRDSGMLVDKEMLENDKT